jgi:hypothetical protein
MSKCPPASRRQYRILFWGQDESGVRSSCAGPEQRSPKHGYALTSVLADQVPRVVAAIDVPGANENEVWQWTLRPSTKLNSVGVPFMTVRSAARRAGELSGSSMPKYW